MIIVSRALTKNEEPEVHDPTNNTPLGTPTEKPPPTPPLPPDLPNDTELSIIHDVIDKREQPSKSKFDEILENKPISITPEWQLTLTNVATSTVTEPGPENSPDESN